VDTPHRNDPLSVELPEQIRQRLHHLERRTPWELALLVVFMASVSGLLAAAIWGRGDLRASFEIPGAVVFGSLALVSVLVWFAQDRSKRARIAEFRNLTEMLHRHACTELAMRDSVSGAYNRSAIRELGERYVRRALRADKPLALAVFDLESFQDLNRSFGYAAADQALAEFAHLLLATTRGADAVARYDADQFVVLLTDTSRLGAELVMLRLRERLASARIRLYEEEVPLRFAWGAAVLQKGMDLPALLREAELDLLRNKTAREATAKSAGK